jgi:hypothetical protein
MSEQRIQIHEPWTQDVACILEAAEAGEQGRRWDVLRAEHLVGVEPIEGGLRVRFRPDAADAVRDVVSRESQCCGFLRLAVATADDAVTVEITGSADAQPVIRALVGQ